MYKFRFAHLAGSLTLCLGLTVIIGWWTRQQVLVQVMPGLVAMVFNTALCFVLAGAALLLPASREKLRQTGQQAAGVMVMGIAIAAGLQNLLGVDFHIDQLFATVWLVDPNPNPGRLAPLTSVAFILVGASLILLHRARHSVIAQRALQILTLATLALGMAGLIGYSLKLDLLYDWYRFVRMAPHTAIGFLLLGTALWSDWYQSLKRSDAYEAGEDRRISALATVILLVMALTAGLAGFVLSAPDTEATLIQNLEAAHANRSQLLDFVISDSFKQAEALASDAALLTSLESAGTSMAISAGVAQHDLAQHVLGNGFSAISVLSNEGAVLSAAGSPDTRAAFALAMRQGATLFWSHDPMLEVRVPIRKKWGRLGGLDCPAQTAGNPPVISRCPFAGRHR